jgi:hypothetical protein
MSCQNKNLAKKMWSLNGNYRAQQMKQKKELFFDSKWQEKYGYKNQGQNNVKTGHMKRLNDYLDKNPELRKKAGKKGGKKTSKNQKKKSQHFFDKKASIQKLGNFVRWGIKIENKRIPFNELHRSFIEYHKKNHLIQGDKTFYTKKEYDNIILQNKNEII